MADKIEMDILATDNFSTTFKRLNGQLIQTTTKQKFMDRGMKSSRTVVTNYGKSVKKTSGAMGKMSSITNSTMLKFIGLTAILSIASKGFQALKEWVKKSIQEFRAFEKKMAEVSTILTGDSLKSIIEVGVEIERLSVTYGKSALDLAKGMYDILSAAFSATEGMKLLEIATKASIAGITDVSISVDVFTSILNAWGKTVSQATTISDQLFQTVVRGKLIFSDLANAMGYIAPIAANLGVEFKEIAAALSTVTRQGQHVDMATRGLALMLQNIANLAPAAGTAAIKYGVDLSDVALRVGGLEYIMKDLNAAMEEHGSHILPQMIRNMRSFRVAVALAGDVGLAGFTKDMGYLNDSTGRTEEAMAKMMNISQQQADILGQSMQNLERDIGKAWSGFDIWAKKAKLWWGSLIAGEDADAAVDAYEERANKLKIAAYEVIKFAAGLKETKPLSEIMDVEKLNLAQYDTMTEKIAALRNAVETEFDFTNLKEYFKIGEKIGEKAEFVFDLKTTLIGMEALKAEWDNLVIQHELGGVPAKEIARMNEKAMKEGWSLIDFGKVTKKDISWGGLGDFFVGIAKDLVSPLDEVLMESSHALQSTEISGGAKRLSKFIKSIGDNVDEWTESIEMLKTKQAMLASSEQEFTGAIHDADEAISTHQENIVTLERAMIELNTAVTDTYTTISGKEFEGKDYWKITSAGMGVAMDRFTRFSQQVIQYGGVMKTDYMDTIQGMVDNYANVDSAQLSVLGSLEWYNKEVFSSIDGIKEFGSNMENVINSLSKYNKKVKEAKEIQSKYTKEMNESKRVMLELNLEAQKIQLKGMLRRRGLTRGEEKKLKEIKIKATEERIKDMEREIKIQAELQETGVEDLKNTSEKAMEIYNEYRNKVKFILADMEDTQDEELKNFLSIINMKEKRLIKYGDLHAEQLSSLETAIVNHQALMGIVAADEELQEMYRKFYGLDALEEAEERMRKHQEFIQSMTYAKSGGAKTSTAPVAPVKPQGMSTKEKLQQAQMRVLAKMPSNMAKFWGKKWGLPGYEEGVRFVPETGLAIVHRGEQIISAKDRGNAGGNTYQISISVKADVKSDYDVERLAAELGKAMQAKLSDIDGKSKYRMR